MNLREGLRFILSTILIISSSQERRIQEKKGDGVDVNLKGLETSSY